MMIHEITVKVGKHRPRKRVGRGESSGLGKTSGRGHKGAASRSGWSLRPAYDGGQLNYIQRLPKRGFSNAQFKKVYHIVNVKALDAVAQNGDEVNVKTLAAAGVLRDDSLPLKVLGEGELSKKLTVTAAKFSASAKAKIEAAGGTVKVDVKSVWRRPRPEKAAKPRSAPAAEAAPQKPEAPAPKKGKPSGKQDKQEK